MRRVWVLMAVVMLTGGISAARAADQKTDIDNIGNRKVAHRSIISEQREVAIGRKYSQQIDKSAKLLKDPVVNEYVNRVAQNVARNSDLKVPLTVKIIDSPVINAFSLPGGFVYLNSGALEAADNESEVAGVLAHEIAHVAARHWASEMTRQTLLQYAMIPLMFVPMTYPVYLGVSTAYNLGVPMAFLTFSRQDEAEADYLGLQYMYKAGYDPNSYVTFFGKVLDEGRKQPGSVAGVFMDHPPTADRIVKSEEEIKQLFPKQERYLESTSEFEDVKARLAMLEAKRLPEKSDGPSLEKKRPASKPAGNTDEKPPVLNR
ncbi:MAG: M48 family metallopeptidase [Terriglobia bacterium]